MSKIKLTKVEKRDIFDIQDEIADLPKRSPVSSVSFINYSGRKYYTVFWENKEYRISIYKNTKHKIFFQKTITRSLGELRKLCNFD